jgi:hypothetical protein
MKKTDCKKTSMDEKLDGKSVYRITKIVAYQARCPQSTDITFVACHELGTTVT